MARADGEKGEEVEVKIKGMGRDGWARAHWDGERQQYEVMSI